MSMTTTTSELQWLTYLLRDFNVMVPSPITLFCDNKSAQQIKANPCFQERTKHIKIDCHYVRDKVQEGFIETSYVPTTMQLADVFTRALSSKQHHVMVSKFGLATSLA